MLDIILTKQNTFNTLLNYTHYMPHYGFRTDDIELKTFLDKQKNKSKVIMSAVKVKMVSDYNKENKTIDKVLKIKVEDV